MGDSEHLHEAADGPSTFWETRLDYPDYILSDPRVETVFVSPSLEEIPDNSLVVFVSVEVSPGGETSVHSLPGPEFIYQFTGSIDYQNGLIGVRPMTPGDIEGIPPVTLVQKRKAAGQTAAFLFWFQLTPTSPSHSPYPPDPLGITDSSPSRAINSSRGTAPRSSPSRWRTATALASCSRSPTTSM